MKLGHLSLLPLVLPLVAGCGSDSQVTVVDDGPVGIPTDHTDPADLLDAWEAALGERDLEAYTALLEADPGARAEPGFRFYPLSDDVPDFPWLQGADSWDRAAELGMIANMFDPGFVSAETNETVDSIEAVVTVSGQDDLGDGEIEVSTILDIRVLWATETGAQSDVRLVHVLAPDADGFLRIREQRELPLFGPRVEDSSWGAIKALYRSGSRP